MLSLCRLDPPMLMGSSPCFVFGVFPHPLGSSPTHLHWGFFSTPSAYRVNVLGGSEEALTRRPCLDTTGTILAGAPFGSHGVTTRCLWRADPFWLAGLIHPDRVGVARATSFGGHASLQSFHVLAAWLPLPIPRVPGPFRGRTLLRQLSLPSPAPLGV